MKPPIDAIQTLEQHKEYAKEEPLILDRLEICYHLYYPLVKAYDVEFWD